MNNGSGPNPGDAPPRRYFGKFRGVVVDNEDPLLLGRVAVNVASVPGVTASLAMPCVPYAGTQVGFVMIPPVGANVWVEFEEGDPSHPIWVGCFWTEGQFPVELAPTSRQKLIKTESVSVWVSDLPGAGGVIVEIGRPGVEIPIRVTACTEGVTLEMAEAVATFPPETEAGFVVDAPVP